MFGVIILSVAIVSFIAGATYGCHKTVKSYEEIFGNGEKSDTTD